jgi:hypothetical protein
MSYFQFTLSFLIFYIIWLVRLSFQCLRISYLLQLHPHCLPNLKATKNKNMSLLLRSLQVYIHLVQKTFRKMIINIDGKSPPQPHWCQLSQLLQGCILCNTIIVNSLISHRSWLFIRFGSKNKLCSKCWHLPFNQLSHLLRRFIH